MENIKNVVKGDIFTFKANDNNYKVFICTNINKERSPQHFTFVALTYDNKAKPSIENIIESEFFGVGNTKNDYSGTYLYSERELEKMWSVHPEIKPYYLGSYGLLVLRKDFMKFRDNFELISNLDIVDNLEKNGSGSMNASNWDLIKDFFNLKYKSVFAERGQKTFKVRAIIRD